MIRLLNHQVSTNRECTSNHTHNSVLGGKIAYYDISDYLLLSALYEYKSLAVVQCGRQR